MSCGAIAAGATFSCDTPIQPGINPRIFLMNKDDIESVTYNATKTYIIEDITMKTDKYAYEFEGYRQSVDAQVEFVPQTLSVGYDHIVNFQVFDISAEQKSNLEKMALSKLVAIIENVNAVGNANSVFEVYGLGAGLEVATLTRLARDLETAGSFSVGLKTSDNEGKESKMPLSFFKTSYAVTLGLIEALLEPVTP